MRSCRARNRARLDLRVYGRWCARPSGERALRL
jgi:hypothetical protein